ncbi:MAG: IS1595 family transposase [Terracidiphilus sp.]|jgi:transposase-like protein
MEPKTLQAAIVYFSDPDNCVRYLVECRWPDGVVCPTCGRTDVSYVAKRRVWQCKTRHPKAQFSVKVGTIFEDSPIPLDKWLMAMWMVSNCKNGISSWEIHRSLGVTQKTAWFLLHRIRLAMQDTRTHKFGLDGPVESDEAFIGPKPRNMHKDRRAKAHAAGRYSNKAAVHGLLDRELRQVRTKVLPNVKRETLQSVILDNVAPSSKIFTDEAVAYVGLEKDYIHEVIDHSRQYVNGLIHTNGLENFWSLLKRGLKGTYVAVEPFHLDAYVDEQAFRYNNRATKDNPLTDADRFALIVSQIVGRRITYRELTGKMEARQF